MSGSAATHSLKLSLRLAIRQLNSNKAFSVSMIINIALGLMGFLVVDGFNRSFRDEINTRTRQIASADLIVSSRLPWTAEQSNQIKSLIPAASVISEEISLVSMVTGTINTRLIEARFIDDHFPLYPGIKLKKSGDISAGHATSLKPGDAWVYRELQSQMGLSIGDTFGLGEAKFTITDVVEDDPTSGSGGFSFAPKVFVRMDDLPKTKLLGLGSRSIHSIRVKLPNQAVSSIDETKLADSIKSSLKKSTPLGDIRVRSHQSATEDLTRLQAYLNDYLSLIAMTALFLAAVGTSYLMRGHLQRTIKEFAILSSLGASPWIAPLVFIIQCVILGIGATILSSAIASGLLPLLAKTMIPISGSIQNLTLPLAAVAMTALFAIASGLLLTMPQLIQLSSLNPGFLFQESSSPTSRSNRMTMLAYVPAILLWWLTAVNESKSWTSGSIFAGVCVASAIILATCAIPLLRASIAATRRSNLNWRLSLALRQLSRNRAATISTFLALSLGTSLINLIPQLRSIIVREIARPDSVIPQLFVFDIQDDQVESVTSFFKSMDAKISHLSPMIRARLESINGDPIDTRKMDFEGEREQQQRESLQARTQNLSYRYKLSSAETITSGSYPTEDFNGQGLPALSIEEGFAKRVNVKIGDRMRFDLMGVPLEGIVTSMRKVRWTSFEPNFMILVQPGVLNDAPKIWVASASHLPPERIDAAQAALIRDHSNVSVVDVKASIHRLLTFIDQVSIAVGIVAWLALAGGAGVLYSIAYAQSLQRLKSIAILKTLGASTNDARTSVLIEYAVISTAAVIFGIVLGILVSWAAGQFILKAQWVPADLGAAAYGFILIPLCLMLAWLATRNATKVSVSSLLD